MAKIPKIPRNLRPDLEQVNDLLQDISTKLGAMPNLSDTFKVNVAPVDDISRKFQGMLVINKKLGENLIARAKAERGLQRDLVATTTQLVKDKKIHDDLLMLQSKGFKLSGKQLELLRDTGKSIVFLKDRQKDLVDLAGTIDTKWQTIGKTIGNQALGALDDFGKGLTALALDSVFFSLGLVQKGLLAVFDLFERTTRAVGDFNLGMGGTTKGLAETRKEAWKVEGTIRSLTGGALGVGLKQWQETSKALGFVGGDFDKMATQATLAARALGIGNAAAGELTRSFSFMGETSKDTDRSFVQISSAANDAGVSVADFGSEINASRDFMASFGKIGRKVFLDSAAYVRKLGVSVKSLEQFMHMTDTFESTAEAAAKMNTVFGTSVSAMDLMLEQDPSKRIEQVRQAMISQGKTADKLNRQELEYFGQTFKLSADEVNAVLKKGMTLDKFHEAQEKAHRKQESAEATIRNGLAATAETLFNFGQGWDKVTAAIARLLNPFLKVLGLSDDFDKKPFGKKMTEIIKKLVGFIDRLGKNDKIKGLIGKWAEDFKNLSGRIGKFIEGGGLEKTFASVATGVGKIYDGLKYVFEHVLTEKNISQAQGLFDSIARNIDKFVIGFGILKGIFGAVTLVKGLAAVTDMVGGKDGLMKALGGLASKATLLTAEFFAVYEGMKALMELKIFNGKSVNDVIQKVLDRREEDAHVIDPSEMFKRKEISAGFKENQINTLLSMLASGQKIKFSSLDLLEKNTDLLKDYAEWGGGKFSYNQIRELLDKAEYAGSSSPVPLKAPNTPDVSLAPPMPTTVSKPTDEDQEWEAFKDQVRSGNGSGPVKNLSKRGQADASRESVLGDVKVVMDGQLVGRLVSPHVVRQMTRDAGSK